MERNIDYEQQFEEQLELTSQLVKDCNAWRDKYRELHRLLYGDFHPATIEGWCQMLRQDVAALEASKKDLEAELESLKKANKSLIELNDDRLAQIRRLRNQSLWERIFNR